MDRNPNTYFYLFIYIPWPIWTVFTSGSRSPSATRGCQQKTPMPTDTGKTAERIKNKNNLKTKTTQH